MIGQKEVACEPARLLQVQENQASLGAAIGELENRVNLLADRLHEVLTEEKPLLGENCAPEVEEKLVSIAAVSRRHKSDVVAIIDTVNNLIHRLEV